MDKLNKHLQFIKRVKKHRGKTLTSITKCCGNDLEMHVPSDDSVWDSVFRCPYCQGINFYTATKNNLVFELFDDYMSRKNKEKSIAFGKTITLLYNVTQNGLDDTDD